jgi:hypothetical protein
MGDPLLHEQAQTSLSVPGWTLASFIGNIPSHPAVKLPENLFTNNFQFHWQGQFQSPRANNFALCVSAKCGELLSTQS